MRRRPSRWLIAAVLMAADSQAAELQPPGPLAELMVGIDGAKPLDRAKLDALLGRHLGCTEGDCDRGPLVVRGARIGHLDVRQGRFGSLLVLEGLAGQCLPVAWVKAFAPGGDTHQSCTDGVLCWYYVARRPWGTLSVRLPDDLDPGGCAAALVFKTAS